MIPATAVPGDIAALQLVDEGFHVLPVYGVVGLAGSSTSLPCACSKGAACKQAGKHPPGNGSTGASADKRAVIAAFEKAGPGANVGIATGLDRGGILVLDVDVDPAKGIDGFARLEALGLELPPTRTARTGRGGRHYFFRITEDLGSVNGADGVGLGRGLDVRARGYYVVAAPSLHRNGSRYEWENDLPIAPIPAHLRALLGERKARTARARRDVVISGPRRAMALDRAARALRARGVEDVSDILRAEADAWASPAMSDAEIAAAVARVASVPVAPPRHGGLVGLVAEGGRNQALISYLGGWVSRGFCAAALHELASRENVRRFAPPLEAAEVESVAHSAARWAAGEPYWEELEDDDEAGDEGWQDQLLRKPEKADGTAGGLLAVADNVTTILRAHPEWRGTVAWDERAGAIRFAGEPPFGRNARSGADRAGSEWDDDDATRVAGWCARNERLVVADGVALAGARLAAKTASFDPVKDYFEVLEWDRVPRLSTWLETYAQATGPEIIRRGVGRMWLISAVARTYEPGCQADYMLVLEGGQGGGKSSLLRAIAPDPSVFQDTPLNLGTKDALQALRGLLICEMAELKAVRGAHSVEEVKAFLSSRTDRYRDSYGHVVAAWPRRCVFAGSVNPEAGAAYLADQTGGRRFWPVPVGETDRTALERDRDQLWAEAVAAYREGEPWHPERGGDLERELEDAVAARTMYDENTTTIALWLGSAAGRAALAAASPAPPGYLSVTEVATAALAISRDRVDERAQKIVRKSLDLLGWRQIPVRYQGARPRVWAPPAD